MKKIILAFTVLILTACTGIEKKHTWPVDYAKQLKIKENTTWILQQAHIKKGNNNFKKLKLMSDTNPNDEITLTFNKDRFSLYAGCNNMMGSFEFDGANKTIKFSEVASTLKACSKELMDRDTLIANFFSKQSLTYEIFDTNYKTPHENDVIELNLYDSEGQSSLWSMNKQ